MAPQADQPRQDIETRHQALLDRIDAGAIDLICLDEAFRSCPLPEQLLALGIEPELVRDYAVGEVRDTVSAADNAAIMRALRTARRSGVGTTRLDPDDAEGLLALTIIDFSEEYGVVIAVTAEVQESSEPGPIEAAPVFRPRRAVQRRDQVAQFIWVDENTQPMLGYPPEAIVGHSALEFIHPDDHDRGIDGWLAMLTGEGNARHRIRWRTADGEWRWMEMTHTNRLDDLGHVETEMLDVDDEMTALARARAGEMQFTTLTESLPVGVVQVNDDQEVIYVNAWLRELTGLGEDVRTGTLINAFDPEDQEALRNAADRAAAGERTDLRVRIRTATGAIRQCNVRIRPLSLDGVPAGAIASFEDITESASLQEELRRQAETDVLTGLANRFALIRHLEPLLDRDTGLALLFFDLDGFKLVNDGLGHGAGDSLLVDVARRVKRLLRPSDLIARVGGDEFVVVCPWATSMADAAHIAERLIAEVQQAFHWSTDSTSINCSVGIALHDGHADITADELISNADLAMYKAKNAGGGRWEPYDHQLREAMTRTFDLQRSIVDSLRSDEFQLHVQPIEELATGRTVAVECLLRWFHPTSGRISTDQLIQIAEQSGLIVPLGRWVLDHACSIAARAAASGHEDLRVSLNLSGRQLSHGGFERDLAEAIERHGINAAQLILEVTETVFIGTDGNIVDTLRELAATGCIIALDDFGTGYSSLNQLRLMPANMLKIDCSYTADLGTDVGTTAITRALVELCADLGIELVAEGIETAAQAATVEQMGIRLGQGYHLGRPMPADRFFAGLPAKR